ncbi:DNA mismatch repair protein MutS [Seonamhaeicola sp. S2-3]|uniref:Smr/MutS family protein n=1 Tax=Seonamhaeicola sp. S2-3 TaxID=1936081 RepID=UPI0009727AD1|nr:Smr/MutS family protein [Seonamhaeicola sp. S2-3]APY11997.1 DNA mismatch repair protein MutS [Seonamhaeicola sp. S2-3]
MNFKKGDTVFVLDEDLSGIVKNLSGDTVSIETEDGFLLDFKAEALVKAKTGSFKNDIFSHSNLNTVVYEKEQSKKRKQPKVKAKERFQPTLEVDLHINQLVKSTRGMTSHDMLTLQLDTAKRQLEFAIKKRIQKVVFIHGVGEGVLKLELEYLFGRYNNIKYYDANYQKYGLGATEVYIYQNVKPN